MCMCVSRSLILGEMMMILMMVPDDDDELIASITYLTSGTYPTLHAPVEWQSDRVQR